MRNAIVARGSSEEGMISTRPLWIYRLTGVVAVALALWLLGAGVARAAVAQHGAITITSDADFTAPGSPTGCACVSAGNGTMTSPYVIGPWAIRAPSGGTSGWAVKIDNSGGGVTDSFVIGGISAAYSGVRPPDPVVWLVDVNNSAGTTVSNVSANEDGVGIELDGSSNITLDSISVNKMSGTGIYINSSWNVLLSNGKYKATSDGLDPASHDADGLYAVDSSNLNIGGPQVPACPKTGVCNTFDYDSGWGVYLKDTSDVVIDNATANADDTGGYILDGGSNITLENSTSEAGGPICISLSGAKSSSGYTPTDLVGGVMLVNGTQNDTISNDTFNGTSASSGFSIADVGNPVYFDVCTKQAIVPPAPLHGLMGSGNTFSNICYATANYQQPSPPTPLFEPLLPSVCTS